MVLSNISLNRFFLLIKWVFSAKTIDHLDSPLLYNFYQEVIKAIPEQQTIQDIEQLRASLLIDNTLIDKVDLGAGSQKHGPTTTICQIAKHSVSNQRKCQLLFQLCSFFKANQILELGSSLGISGLYLSASRPEAILHSVDGDPALVDICNRLKLKWATNLSYHSMSFGEFLSNKKEVTVKYDFIYIHGGHSSKILLPLFEQLQSLCTKDCVFVIDDIYWSTDMTFVWHELKAKPQFNLVIDLGYFGLLQKAPAIHEKIDMRILPFAKRWNFGFFR